MLVYTLLERSMGNDQAAGTPRHLRHGAELTARSLAPGSALGCLDAVASIVVENACERPLFASPEAVAAAVGYIDARFSLLVASAALAERNKTVTSLHSSGCGARSKPTVTDWWPGKWTDGAGLQWSGLRRTPVCCAIPPASSPT